MKSVADSEAGSLDDCGIDDSDLLSAYLAIERKFEKTAHLAKKQENKTNAQKHIALLDRIFDYIHVALCC